MRIDVAPTLSAPAGETGEVVEFEDAIDMARGVFSGFDVQHAVDGWPASLTFPYGEGQVLLTTVGARAWVKPYVLPDPTKPDPRPPLMVSRFVPASPMEDLAAFALAKRPADTLPTSELQPVAEEFVSYEIPDWSVVIGAMAVFVLLLTVLAVLLVRTNKLEHFGWSGSLIAVLFGIALMWIGVSSRYSVPETTSTVQVVQAIGGSDDVRSKGVIGVYRQEGNAALIRSGAGGRIWPQAAGGEGTVTRLVTSDLARRTGKESLSRPGCRSIRFHRPLRCPIGCRLEQLWTDLGLPAPLFKHPGSTVTPPWRLVMDGSESTSTTAVRSRSGGFDPESGSVSHRDVSR